MIWNNYYIYVVFMFFHRFCSRVVWRQGVFVCASKRLAYATFAKFAMCAVCLMCVWYALGVCVGCVAAVLVLVGMLRRVAQAGVRRCRWVSLFGYAFVFVVFVVYDLSMSMMIRGLRIVSDALRIRFGLYDLNMFCDV